MKTIIKLLCNFSNCFLGIVLATALGCTGYSMPLLERNPISLELIIPEYIVKDFFLEIPAEQIQRSFGKDVATSMAQIIEAGENRGILKLACECTIMFTFDDDSQQTLEVSFNGYVRNKEGAGECIKVNQKELLSLLLVNITPNAYFNQVFLHKD